ncbi:c-type cytochrome [Fluviispira multicolorata]|uniref:C-type cytochrome n=1 Tax=Fluviispira multicolorata TaxID=2654512 RepID=A0A833N434_9BACT|nr:c-type cytochrome [Fluviispira multicolorata]KAB8030994.1 c-type cytochrome [Fluviispira multicolorata]
MVQIKCNNKLFSSIIGATFLSLTLIGCRGQKSENPPILPIQNMVEQTSFGPQSKNEFYKDGRAYRPQILGTVEFDKPKTDKRLYEGKEPDSTEHDPKWVKKIPLKLSEKDIQRGQAKYVVFCTPCHGYAGDSDGLVTQRAGGVIRPSNIHDKERLALPVGKIYDAIHNGVNNWNMPGFASQLSVEDKWAVVAYVRALQLTRRATLENIPADIKAKHGWSNKQ